MNLSFMDSGEVLKKALAGERPFPDEAVHLCNEGSLLDLAMAAREVARRHSPDGQVGYSVSRTVRYSNVCQPQCPFCAGTVTADDPAAFTKTADEVVAEVAEAAAAGATQIVLQGGHRIDLPWSYYPGLVRAIKDRFPDIQVLAYSPTEIMVFNVAYQKRTSEVIGELQAAGMGALLAGGSQTLPARAPEYRALLRGPWNEWFDVVHRCADAGIPVIAPFVFGLGETAKERVGHLYRVRAVQERTAMAKKPAFAALSVFTLSPDAATGHEYLRMLALARVLVPTIPHVQSGFVSQGAKVAQVALDGGASDMGGTHMEFAQAELAAGRVGAMTAAEMERLIREAGRTPVERKHWQ
ncbi:MAG TPA: radical SAM protein [Symbiobacteriaceae bacterium]|nr:radical SAM protein [Symbiobacteriaceae bacterium]